MMARFRIVTPIILIVAGIVVAFVVLHPGSIMPPAYADDRVVAQESTIDGQQVGDVLVDGQVIFRIRTSSGGLNPYQRAQVVAERLGQLMSESLKPGSITTGRVNGQDVVMANNQVIVTADPAHARINNTTPMQLSNLWAQRLENAVAGRATVDTPLAEKVVPIISVGSGTRLGGALVSGARDRVNEVKAVAQIEGQFGNAVRVRALVPVSTENVVQNIRRVPETSVIGLVDIRL
jgi:hypothetical protein